MRLVTNIIKVLTNIPNQERNMGGCLKSGQFAYTFGCMQHWTRLFDATKIPFPKLGLDFYCCPNLKQLPIAMTLSLLHQVGAIIASIIGNTDNDLHGLRDSEFLSGQNSERKKKDWKATNTNSWQTLSWHLPYTQTFSPIIQ